MSPLTKATYTVLYVHHNIILAPLHTLYCVNAGHFYEPLVLVELFTLPVPALSLLSNSLRVCVGEGVFV